MYLHRAYLPFLIILVIGCNQQDEKLYEEVMQIHDEVMPKTGEISKLSRTFRMRLSKVDSSEIHKYKEIIKELDQAEDAMFEWMEDFKPPKESKSKEEYLKKQKVEIEKVKDMMMTALENAQKLQKNATE